MGLEIEKKYLLKSAKLLDLLVDDGLSLDEQKVVQFYTRVTKNKETRFRKIGSHYKKTIKEGVGLVRKENEEAISSKTFKAAKSKKLGTFIDKKRYTFKIQNLPSSIDIYRGDLRGLAILEIEFLDEEMAQNFKLPALIDEEIKEDVTTNESFKNRNLALFGMPIMQKNKTLEEIFSECEKNPLKVDVSSFLPSGMDSYSALRAIFYSLLQMILFYKNSYLKSVDSEDLHQFRVNIRKTRSLLQCVENLFDKSITQRFIDDFKTIANATNTKRDLDVFLEFLEGLDEIEAETLLKIFDTQEDKESEAIFKMLHGETFSRVIQEWEIILRDDDRFFAGKSANSPLKEIAATSLIKRLKRMQKRLSCLDESTDIEFFHRVRIEFKRLRYLSEYFLTLFDDKNIDKMTTVSRKMQNLFGILQDRDVGLDILDSVESSEEFSGNVAIVYALNQIVELINDDIYSIRTKILMRKEKLFKTLNASIKSLEAYKLS